MNNNNDTELDRQKRNRSFAYLEINGKEIKNPILRFLFLVFSMLIALGLFILLLVILLPLFGLLFTFMIWVLFAGLMAIVIAVLFSKR